jgi:hypothetical protein
MTNEPCVLGLAIYFIGTKMSRLLRTRNNNKDKKTSICWISEARRAH